MQPYMSVYLSVCIQIDIYRYILSLHDHLPLLNFIKTTHVLSVLKGKKGVKTTSSATETENQSFLFLFKYPSMQSVNKGPKACATCAKAKAKCIPGTGTELKCERYA